MTTRPQPDPGYGEALRAAREAVTSAATGKKMTQLELATRMGCSVTLLGRWEKGAKGVHSRWWSRLAACGMPVPRQETPSAAASITELTDRLTGILEHAARIAHDLEQHLLSSASDAALDAEVEKRRRRVNISPP